MFSRASAVAVLLIFLVSLASARPAKKLHYDERSMDSYEYFPIEGPRAQPEQVPQDPVDALRELVCDPVVVRGFVQAWKSTLDGTRNHGLAETGFAIHKYVGSLSIQGWREAVANDLFIPADDDTIAVAHVHGRGADEHPAKIDVQSRVPNFVISRAALYVTIPGTSRFILVRGGVDDVNGWNKPCNSRSESASAQRKTGTVRDAYNLKTF